MKISQLVDSLSAVYPKKYKTLISKRHNEILSYVIAHYDESRSFKNSAIYALNYASYTTVIGDTYIVDKDNPLSDIPKIDVNRLVAALNKLYLKEADIDWDIDVVDSSTDPAPAPVVKSAAKSANKPMDKAEIKSESKATNKTASKPKAEKPVVDTPKEWLYLMMPQYPKMKTDTVFLDDTVGMERFYIHPSLPIIPEKQSEISVTTDVNRMTERDLLNLFPNCFIRTRNKAMYEPYDNIPMDKDLGLLLPIKGYTQEQIRENIIKYPHSFKLSRILDDKEISFYKHIELDGKLYDTLEVWDSLPDSKYIPKNAEFIKEYIVRKYLLDRDNGVEHKYPLRGTLEPYITLFAPPSFYNEDPANLARKCVAARISYLRSRNPYLERYKYVMQGKLMPNTTITCPHKQYCMKSICNTVCPNYVEFDYLMERNNLLGDKKVFSFSDKMLSHALECLVAASETYKVVITGDTSDMASCLTYASICQHYIGNAFHCSVYHLNFMEYINKLQQSWSTGIDEDLEYTNIFLERAKVVIISNLDFVQFKDFQSQTLLNIAHNRKLHRQSTLIVSPNLNSLIGSGAFFARLKEVFGKEVI